MRVSRQRTFGSMPSPFGEPEKFRVWMMAERSMGWLGHQSPSTTAAHISFILLACSYGFGDILHLRALAVFSGLSMMLYNRWHPHGSPLWLPFRWNLLFVLINLFHISVILDRERRSALISPVEKRLYDRVFASTGLSRVDFMKLLKSGKWESFGAGEKLTREGRSNNKVYLIERGRAQVIVNGLQVYELSSDQFVGEMGLSVGLRIAKSLKSAASVVVTEDMEAFVWSRGSLIDILEENHDLATAFQASVSADLVRKALGPSRSANSGQPAPQSSDGSTSSSSTTSSTSSGLNFDMATRNIAQYLVLLNSVVEDGHVSSHERNTLSRLRYLHYITDQEHKNFLAERGWTLQEYNEGLSKGAAEKYKQEEQKQRQEQRELARSNWIESSVRDMVREPLAENIELYNMN